MLYSCNHMATVGVKWLIEKFDTPQTNIELKKKQRSMTD